MGCSDNFVNVQDILDKLSDEARENTHTKLKVLVSHWTIDTDDKTLTRKNTDWLEDGYLSTRLDWQWKPFDVMKTVKDGRYNIIDCDKKIEVQPMIWSNAMQQIRDAFDQNQISKLYFHPLQEFDCRCQHLALNCNVMVFLLHMDGIVMGHLLTLDTEHITVGFLLLNLNKNAKKSRYYFRISIIPKIKEWTTAHIMMLVQKEIDSWKRGFPMRDPNDPNKFVMVYPIFLGILADGKEIADMIGKLQLQSFAGALFLKECIRIHPTFIGTDTAPCFISRRFLTNEACSFCFWVFLLNKV